MYNDNVHMFVAMLASHMTCVDLFAICPNISINFALFIRRVRFIAGIVFHLRTTG